jgi:hypothetical protein
MWMHNHSIMATNLVLGEFELLPLDGLSDTCILNRGKHFECEEVKRKLSKYLHQCSAKCRGDTEGKSARHFLNSTQDSCSYMREESSAFDLRDRSY